MAKDERSATEIAATAAADAGVRPIDSPTRRNVDPDAKRAESRGIYEDREGTRRVVAAGDAIPEGWSLVDDTPLEDRAASTPTARDPQQEAGTSRSRRGRRASGEGEAGGGTE